MGEVGLHRGATHQEPLGDLGVGEPEDDELHHRPFCPGEAAPPKARSVSFTAATVGPRSDGLPVEFVIGRDGQRCGCGHRLIDPFLLEAESMPILGLVPQSLGGVEQATGDPRHRV